MLVLSMKPHDSTRIDFPGRKALLTLLEINTTNADGSERLDRDILVEITIASLSVELFVAEGKPGLLSLGDLFCEVTATKIRSTRAEIGFDLSPEINVTRMSNAATV